MKFEVLKRSHLKKNIIIGIIVVLIFSAIILTFTRAKYRVTQSIPLVSGTISFSPYDFNFVAMYLNQEGALPEGQTKIVPKFGYTLNEEQSTCIVEDTSDDRIKMTYVTQTTEEEAYVDFHKMSQSGTKCSIYFDLIPDSENPILSISTSSTDTSITVTANATDNIGIYYYYFKLDSGEEVRLEENTYTFEGLQKDSVHTVSVRVKDATGNEASGSEEVVVGLKASEYLLAKYSTVLTRTDFSTTVTETTTGTIYKSANKSQYDNDGKVYYFAGNPTDNWFQFGTNSSGQPLYWRIVRINGDGSVRLIYNGTNTTTTGDSTMININQKFNSSDDNNMYVGYMYESGEVHGLTTNSNIKTTIDSWYISNLADEAEYLDGNAGFCGDRTPYNGSGTGTSSTYYAAYNRLNTNKSPSFKCSNGNDLYTTPDASRGNKALKVSESDKTATPIGLISADEVAFAGGVWNTGNSSYYLYNGANYWTISPFRFSNSNANVFIVKSDGNLQFTPFSNVYYVYGVRPVINLKSAIAISGSGTTTDPFKIVGA